jgi:GTPase involved in cell partitioning and DNA repair
MKHGYHSEDPQNARSAIREPSTEDQVHCIIFVIAAKSTDNADYITRLKQFIEEAETAGKKYIVAISQFDKDEEKFREYPQTLPEDKHVKDTTKQLASKLGIQPNLIFPVLNYTEETSKNEYIDIMALRILNRALHIAEDYMEDQERDAKFRHKSVN